MTFGCESVRTERDGMMRKNMSRFWPLVLLLFALSTAAIVAGCGKAQSGDGAGQTAKEQTLDEKVDAIVD